MKLFKDITIGVLIGITAFAGVIFSQQEYRAAEAVSLTTGGIFTELLADIGVAQLDYDDVFGSATYKNLYAMMMGQVFVEPENEALILIAKKYGISPQGASAVAGGSPTPLLNSSTLSGSEMTQQQLFDMATQAKEDFLEEYEILSLEQDLAIVSSSSEIFSNGDVADSGFDLVYDLEVIEKLLFEEVSDTTLGGPINWGKDDKPSDDAVVYPPAGSNYEPSASALYEDELIALKNDAGDNGISSGDGDESGPEFLNDISEPQILEEDVCPTDESPLADAIDDFEEEAEAYYEQEELAAGQPGADPAGPAGDDGGGAGPVKGKSILSDLPPVDPAQWLKPLECNGILFLNGEAGDTDGAAVSKVTYYMCLEGQTIWESYSSYIPAKKCIFCELEKIQTYLNETLSHSLTPNKVTGNIGESSKCKNTLTMPLIDIQFIQLWAPAITPPNDDAIYGKNLLKEWDKFIKRGHPYGISNSGVTQLLEYSTELAADIAYSKVTPDSDFTSLLQDINEIQSFVTKDQVDNIEQFEIISKGEDFIVYSQSVMAEIKTMTMYFKNFMNMFKEIGEEICPSIAEKPYKD